MERTTALSFVVLGLVAVGCASASPNDSIGERGDPAIYGTDNRHEIYEVTNTRYRQYADSTVGLVPSGFVLPNADGKSSTIGTFSYGAGLDNLCPTERFYGQRTRPFCTGVLVAPRIVATAYHCLPNDSAVEQTSFVFGFKMFDARSANTLLPNSQIYR